jgi:hypothetical protein
MIKKKGPVEIDLNRQRPNLNAVDKKASKKPGRQYTADLALSSGGVVRMERLKKKGTVKKWRR